MNGHCDIVEFLLDYGIDVDVNQKEIHGVTALNACYHIFFSGHPEVRFYQKLDFVLNFKSIMIVKIYWCVGYRKILLLTFVVVLLIFRWYVIYIDPGETKVNLLKMAYQLKRSPSLEPVFPVL